MKSTGTIFRNKIKIWFLQSTLVVIALWILFMPSVEKYDKGGDNIFTVKLGSEVVGIAGSEDDVYEAYRNARRNVASGSDELVFDTAELSCGIFIFCPILILLSAKPFASFMESTEIP